MITTQLATGTLNYSLSSLLKGVSAMLYMSSCFEKRPGESQFEFDRRVRDYRWQYRTTSWRPGYSRFDLHRDTRNNDYRFFRKHKYFRCEADNYWSVR